MPDIGFITLPPFHRKHALHRPDFHVYSANLTVPRLSTLRLMHAAELAKVSGSWEQYKMEWILSLQRELADSDGRIVILVTESEIGKRAGWTDLGSFVLRAEVWEENLARRGHSSDEFFRLFHSALADGAQVCGSNKELVEKVNYRASEWRHAPRNILGKK
jgi:hypothetical protein